MDNVPGEPGEAVASLICICHKQRQRDSLSVSLRERDLCVRDVSMYMLVEMLGAALYALGKQQSRQHE